MPDITIYTKAYCPYCADAKDLLNKKKVSFHEIAVTNSDIQAKMTKLAGGRTSVPQIWIGERHIGGCDDIYALDAKGELDKLLANP
jgi:glutaredoxin 3